MAVKKKILILKALNLKLCRKKKFFVENNVPKKEAEKGRKRFCDNCFCFLLFF
jgi:hypothetical protein